MIANLIDNGIRHNEPGGFLEVSTRVAAAASSCGSRNGGPVIDPEDASTLTEPFRRLDRSVDGLRPGAFDRAARWSRRTAAVRP